MEMKEKSKEETEVQSLFEEDSCYNLVFNLIEMKESVNEDYLDNAWMVRGKDGNEVD